MRLAIDNDEEGVVVVVVVDSSSSSDGANWQICPSSMYVPLRNDPRDEDSNRTMEDTASGKNSVDAW